MRVLCRMRNPGVQQMLSSLARRSEERLNSGLRAPENERVHVVCALVGVYRFEVHHVTHDMEFVADAVAAVHVAGHAGNVQRRAAVVALEQ